jgi:pimeloyl-ACP methyl ester carboxylesterase
MSEEQALDLLRHVEAPVLTLHVTPESPWFTRELIEARKAAIGGARHLTLEGHHHFHMDAPGGIAETIRSFILEHELQPPTARDHQRQGDE